MPTYIAFLRAINLGSRRKFPKAEIIAATEAAGCTEVETYINTGNVRLTTSRRSRARVEAALEAAYLERTGFEVPTIVFPPAELAAIAGDAHELHAARPDLERHDVALLKDEPDPAWVAQIEAGNDGVNEVVVRGRAAHVLLGRSDERGAARSASWSGPVSTTRNVRVVTTLAARWCWAGVNASAPSGPLPCCPGGCRCRPRW